MVRYWLFIFDVPENGVFRVSILVFSLEKVIIGSGALPQLIPFFTDLYDIAPFGPKVQTCFHWLNKGLAPHSDTARPFVLAFLLRIWEGILVYGSYGLFTPLNLFFLCLSGVFQMYPGIKCRFALAINIREKWSFCPRKTQYRPISEGRIDHYPLHIK